MPSSWNNPVIMQEAQALMALTSDLEEPFEKAVSIMAGASGKIICTGIGKSGHVANKMAITLNSMGSAALYLDPTDPTHGDLGGMTKHDVVFAFSRSGRAVEMAKLMEYAKCEGVPVILISENDQDSLAAYATVVLKMPPMKEDWGHAPTTSTIIQMAIGDAIAVTLAQKKEFAEDVSAVALALKKEF